MSKSQRLRIRDIRAIMELMGDVQGLAGDPTTGPLAWRQRFVDGVTTLFHGKQGVMCFFKGHSPDGELSLVPEKLVQAGDADESDRRIWSWWAAEGNPRLDLCADRSSRIARPFAAYTRSWLVPDGEWRNSPFFEMVPKPTRTDGAAFGFYRLDGPGDWVQGWVAHRCLGDPVCGKRERRIAYLLTRQLYRLYQRGILDPGDDPRIKALTSREREVLDLLLQGLSDREIADRLHRSWHTVRDYTKRLYKHFGVRSRAELIARFRGA